jgi:hypothetical protein
MAERLSRLWSSRRAGPTMPGMRRRLLPIASGWVILGALYLCGCSQPAHSVDIELWHCGISPVKVDGQTWEVPHPPPFDGASTLPKNFTGHGTATVENDKLVYVDDGGARIVFRPAEDVPRPPPCM